MDFDHAKYVGDIQGYRDMVADIRPHLPTLELPLAYRKVFVRWHSPELIHHDSGEPVSRNWHLMPAHDFKILIPIKA